jgi:GTP cyclohydrolase I
MQFIVESTIKRMSLTKYSDRWCVCFRHMCMVMRGVQKLKSKTLTSAMLGAFREDQKSRDEFLSLTRTSH